MQCNCGGSTKGVDRERVRKGVVIARLSYNECTSCGRVSDADLFELDEKTGDLVYVTSGKPGPHWEDHGF